MSEHELWNELGNLYFMSGAYPQAIYAYHRSMELDAGFGRPYSNLALAYVQQGKYEQAIELYRRSIELLAENKDKAISWNRLGNVYRHLKDYSKAVIAYQQADELDPEASEVRDTPGELTSSLPLTPVPEPNRMEQDNSLEAQAVQDYDAALNSDDAPEASLPKASRTSWTLADPTQYQQNVSESPKSGSLTTWGDPNFDDDSFEVYPSMDPETEVYIPDPDGDDLSTWLPMPEEEPSSDIETAQCTAAVHEVVPASEAKPATSAHLIEPATFPTLLPAISGTHALEEPAKQSDSRQNKAADDRESIHRQEVDVDVEDRPSSEFVLAVDPVNETTAELNIPMPEAQQPPVAEAPADVMPDPVFERDEDEMREIEAGIAKFKRVVQLNSRNAHAWDALGTLYKSAELYKDAILAYQQAITSDPSKSLYYHHLGLVYACEGRDEDAIGAFQRVIEIDPDYSLAHATLGGYYRKMGLEELAQKHIGKAMKNIFDSENEYNRACLEAICGNADQAIQLLQVALKNKQTYVDWILRDPDLDFIRQDPRFKQLISDYTR